MSFILSFLSSHSILKLLISISEHLFFFSEAFHFSSPSTWADGTGNLPFNKHFFFFFLTSLLEYNCFTMVCQLLLYNKVNQLYIYIPPHVSSLLHVPIPLLQVVTKHRADLPVLCGCFPLAIYFTFGSVYMSMPLSQSQLTLPTPRVLKSILYVSVYIPVLPLGSSEPFFFFLDSIYMCQHTVFAFLFLTCFTLYDRLQVHPPHYK